MGYEVLALKYRPQVFDDCVGQEEVAKTLKNAINQNRVGHAYLFTGPRGVGKTSLARIFAKALNCPEAKDGNPCNICSQCVSISKCNSMDVIEFDGASNNKVEDIRDLIANVDYQPVNSKYKIYIIDEVHMVTTQAFNALLKTLEEPPAHVKFIFATTEIQKLPETILSRCQILGFRQIQQADIVRRLKFICEKENFKYEEEALFYIASKARGAHRDSQSLLDQVVAYSNANITVQAIIEVTGSISDQDLINLIDLIFHTKEADIFPAVKSFINKGFDLGEICERMMELLRDIIVIQECRDNAQGLLTNPFYFDPLKALSLLVRRDGIQYMIQMLAETKGKIKHSNIPHVLLEMTILKMCHSSDLISIPEIIKELKSSKISLGTSNVQSVQTISSSMPSSTPEVSKSDNPLFRKKKVDSPSENMPHESNQISEQPIKTTPSHTPSPKAEILNGWARILSDINKQDPTTGNILTNNNACIAELTDKTVSIQIDGNTPRIISSLDTDVRKQMISASFFNNFHVALKVVFILSDKSSQKKSPELKIDVIPSAKVQILPIEKKSSKAESIRKGESEVLSDPDLQKIITEFGAQVVGIVKKENK
jgi:DNA polymerase-3 subunit gamma/tau